MPLPRQETYTHAELIRCGRGELFGAGNAQLPLPPMLMFDRITHISENSGAHGPTRFLVVVGRSRGELQPGL